MTRIFVLLNLRPGVDRDAYEAWVRTTDLPIARGLPSIAGFDVFTVFGLLGSDAKPPYEYIEVVDVTDMDQFGRDIAQEVMQRVASEFHAFADPLFLLSRRMDA